MTAKTRTCRDCGATFNASRADSTVRCIDCRRGGRKRATSSTCGGCGGTGKIGSRSAVTGDVTWFACHVCGGSGVRA